MDGIKNVEQLTASWWQFFDYCFNYNPGSLLCEPFWAKLIGVFVFLGVVAVGVGICAFLSYRRKYNAAIRAQWEREQSDEVGIREATWNGDKAYQAELPDEEVLDRIRAGIEQRKREIASPIPKA